MTSGIKIKIFHIHQNKRKIEQNKPIDFGALLNFKLSIAECFRDFRDIDNFEIEHGSHFVSCQDTCRQWDW